MFKKLLNKIKGNDNQLISESTETPEQECLTICRDSVCLADDIEDHHIKMSPLEENTYLNIFKAVNDSRYLPRMTAEKQFWAMVVEDKGELKEVIEYYGATDKYLIIENKEVSDMNAYIHFRYYSRGR